MERGAWTGGVHSASPGDMVERQTLGASDLARIPMFAQMPGRALAELAELGHVAPLALGEVLFHEGDPSDEVAVLLEGRVVLTVRLDGTHERSLLTLGPGELLGWSGLLGGTRMASARALSAGRRVAFPGGRLRALCEADHEVGYAVMKATSAALAERLVDAHLQVLDLFGVHSAAQAGTADAGAGR